MPIGSIEVTSIEARRFTSNTEREPEQVRVDHNSTVTLVQKVTEDESLVDFRYTASYGSLGIIKLEGKATVQGPRADTLQATWESEQQMPQEVASQVHTAVMRTCVPEAVFLARDLQLPPPIPLPQVRFEEQQGSADASSQGPEVH